MMVFTICERNEKTGQQNCDLYYTTFSYGVWNGIRPVPNVNGPNSWESQPSISPNGDVLYFTSNRKGGFGGLDLYRSERQGDGSWSSPENLGSTINTAKNEKSPLYIQTARACTSRATAIQVWVDMICLRAQM